MLQNRLCDLAFDPERALPRADRERPLAFEGRRFEAARFFVPLEGARLEAARDLLYAAKIFCRDEDIIFSFFFFLCMHSL